MLNCAKITPKDGLRWRKLNLVNAFLGCQIIMQNTSNLTSANVKSCCVIHFKFCDSPPIIFASQQETLMNAYSIRSGAKITVHEYVRHTSMCLNLNI